MKELGDNVLIRVIVPAACPKMNQYTNMPLKYRIKLPSLCHKLLLGSLTTAEGLRTPIPELENGTSMDSLKREFYKMIHHNSSRKSGTGKSKSKTGKKSER